MHRTAAQATVVGAGERVMAAGGGGVQCGLGAWHGWKVLWGLGGKVLGCRFSHRLQVRQLRFAVGPLTARRRLEGG